MAIKYTCDACGQTKDFCDIETLTISINNGREVNVSPYAGAAQFRIKPEVRCDICTSCLCRGANIQLVYNPIISQNLHIQKG